MKIDIDHYKICLSNNSNIKKKIEYIIGDEFISYCKRKKISYQDTDEMEDN